MKNPKHAKKQNDDNKKHFFVKFFAYVFKFVVLFLESVFKSAFPSFVYL